MSADRCQSLPANLQRKDIEPYKQAPWFILLQDTPRVDSRWKQTNAEKGEIFQYDPEATQEAEKNSEKPRKHSKSKKIIMGAIDSKRVKVEWHSALFAALSHEEKDLLLAIDSPKTRISTFYDSGEFLSFGCGLKEGDMVQVSSSALAKSQKDDVHGELKYKGPLMSARGFDPKGTHFGVQLAAKCGSSSGVYKGTAYFRCREDYAVFIPINKLVPVSKQRKSKYVKEEQCVRSSHPEEDTTPKPSYFKEGDEVEVQASLKRKLTKREWINGRVVICMRHEGRMLIGVEVAQDHEIAINANGFYMGKSVFVPKNPAHTVLADIVDVRSCQSAQQEYQDKNPPTKSPVQEDGHLQQRHANKDCKTASPVTRKNNSSKVDKDNDVSELDRKPAGKTSAQENALSEPQNIARSTTASSSTGSGQLSERTQRQDTRHRSHKYQHSSERVVQMEGPELRVTLSNPQFEQPQILTVNALNIQEHHFAADTDPKGSKPKESQGRKADEKKQHVKQKDFQNKSIFPSALVDFFKGHEQPSFPLEEWELFEISRHGKDLLKRLARDLHIKASHEIIGKEADITVITSDLLKTWWESLHEDHTASYENLKVSLKKNECVELVSFMEGVLPTDGSFHASIVQTVIHKLRSNLSLLAHKLEVEIASPRLPPSVLGDEIFKLWQEKHPGTEKLTLLMEAIRGISHDVARSTGGDSPAQNRQSQEFQELALDLEQGLSAKVIDKISSCVPKAEWYNLGYSLSLTELRLRQFDKHFPYLKERVFQMLRYWQMTQSYDVDQCEKLIVALQSCSLEEPVRLVSKGLSEECLLHVARCIGSKWKLLAGYVFGPQGIHHLIKSSEKDEDKAMRALRKWKRMRPASSENLQQDLFEALKHCKLFRAAKLVFDGLDVYTLYNLARKVMFDMHPLGKALGVKSFEMRDFEKINDPVQSSLALLKFWNEINVQDMARIEKLCHALKQVGLEDVADWLRNSGDDDEDGGDMEYHNQKSAAEATGNPEPEVKAVDRLLLEKVARQLKEHKADISLLKEFLKMTTEDSKFEPKPLHMKADPYLYTLMTWRQKMKHFQLGKQEIGLILRESLKGCGLDEAANLISDGTPVDGKGAVGGLTVLDSEKTTENFNVNSMIEFDWGGKMYQGTILWLGHIQDLKDHGAIAGIETEEPLEFGGNSLLFRKMKTLECDYDRGIFIPLKRCRPDSRFPSESQMMNDFTKTTKEDFGNIECDPIENYIPPIKELNADRVGMYKGIQGDHNSCYMDVTLYSMFAFNGIFDEILGWPRKSEDEVQLIKDVLREQIVNPLRLKGVVRADYILHFREMLNELSSMKGLRTEEKDPEEFIHTLLQELLNAKPFLKIRQGENTTMDSFIYQIFLGKQDFLKVPSVEQLVHLSFLESDLKLTEVPECFIVQLPRFGKQFKLYDWIIPSLEMNIAPIVKNSTRPCTVCFRVAFSECKDCRPKKNTGDDIIHSYCGECWKQRHEKFPNHKAVSVTCGPNFMDEYNYITNFGQDPMAAESIYDNYRMELFSVMCIETSHYVAFVKTGSGENSQWVFFDSMADRIGDHKGFNVPKVTHIRNFEQIIKSENLTEQLKLPDFHPHIKRLLGDAYICFYRLVKNPESPCHGSDRSRHTPQNVDQTSLGRFQEPLRREESFQSPGNSIDIPSTETLSSNILLHQMVLRPPEEAVAIGGHNQEQNKPFWGTAKSSSVEDMDTEDSATYVNSSQAGVPESLLPNTEARLKRHRSSDNPSGRHMPATGQNIQNQPPRTYNKCLSVTLQVQEQPQINQQSSAGNSHQHDPAATRTNIHGNSHQYDPASTRTNIHGSSHQYDPASTRTNIHGSSHQYDPAATRTNIHGSSHQYDPAATRTNIPWNDRPSHPHTSGKWMKD